MKREEIEGVLIGLKICKEMWAQGVISHEMIVENEKYYNEELAALDEFPAPLQPIKSKEEVLNACLAPLNRYPKIIHRDPQVYHAALTAMQTYAAQFTTGYSREQMEEMAVHILSVTHSMEWINTNINRIRKDAETFINSLNSK